MNKRDLEFTKYEVGDRVECKGMMSDLDLNGQTGEIIKIDKPLFRINFDIKFSKRLHSNDNRCWDVYEENIKYVVGRNYDENEEENKWWLDE